MRYCIKRNRYVLSSHRMCHEQKRRCNRNLARNENDIPVKSAFLLQLLTSLYSWLSMYAQYMNKMFRHRLFYSVYFSQLKNIVKHFQSEVTSIFIGFFFNYSLLKILFHLSKRITFLYVHHTRYLSE